MEPSDVTCTVSLARYDLRYMGHLALA
ncbi:MAG: hypothetical protein RIT46_1002, partial [Pseudomonadota bacterium]